MPQQPQSVSCPRRDQAGPEELLRGLLPVPGTALPPLPPGAALEGSADTEGTLQKAGTRGQTLNARANAPRAHADGGGACKRGAHKHVQTLRVVQVSTCAG